MNITFEYDRDVDAIYLRLRDVPYSFGENLDHRRRVDFGQDRQPIGIELLNVRAGVNLDDLPQRVEVARVLEKHGIQVHALSSA